ncbi:MAG: ribonuclease D [Gammaproteobacteria bacterium]
MLDSAVNVEQFLNKCKNQQQLGLDTEFLRVKTYYPQLCLIQISNGQESVCIDPLTESVKQVLANFLREYQGTWLMHACKQDLEVLAISLGVLPANIFDTQIAAALLGIGAQSSYAALVSKICDVELEKSQTRTNWCQRPLTSAQLEYAEADVQYLSDLYEEFSNCLADKGRQDWMLEECNSFGTLDDFIGPQPPLLIKAGADLGPDAQNRLWNLMKWRESRAQKLDLPREWVINSHDLVNIARANPTDKTSLRDIVDLQIRSFEKLHEPLLNVLSNELENAPNNFWPVRRGLDDMEKKRLKSLQKMLLQIASEEEVEPTLVANRKNLENLILGLPGSLDSGWRKELAGDALKQQLSNGI